MTVRDRVAEPLRLSACARCATLAAMKSSRRQRPTDAWKIAEAYGCDMALLERNLRMSPAKRVETHSQALALVKALRKAKIRPHA